MSLEHSYRRLLRAYPSSYRERRGEEIITTLMDDASSGQRRPDRLASADLILGGLRERFGLHNVDGLAAGAALAGPVCLTLAAADALAALLEGPRSTAGVAVAGVWVLAVVGRALAPRWGSLVLVLALVVTGGALATGQPLDIWRVAVWGLAALVGDCSPLARSVSRSRAVRLGVPITVATLTGLTLWWLIIPPIPFAVAYVEGTASWRGVIADLVVIAATVAGGAVAAHRRRARVAWAAFVVLAAWALAGGAVANYMLLLGDRLGLALDWTRVTPYGPMAGVIAAQVLIVGVVAVARRRVGGPALHRVGGIAIGFVGGLLAVPLVDLIGGGQAGSLWDVGTAVGASLAPLWIPVLTMLVVAALVDRWMPAPVQRWLLAVGIGMAAASSVLDPSRSGMMLLLWPLPVIGLITRDGRQRDSSALVGLGLGLAGALLLQWGTTLPDRGFWPFGVVWIVELLLLAGAATVAGVGLITVEWSWWGTTALAAAALWPMQLLGRDLVPPMVVAVGVALVGLALARSRDARTRPVAPVEGSA